MQLLCKPWCISHRLIHGCSYKRHFFDLFWVEINLICVFIYLPLPICIFSEIDDGIPQRRCSSICVKIWALTLEPNIWRLFIFVVIFFSETSIWESVKRFINETNIIRQISNRKSFRIAKWWNKKNYHLIQQWAFEATYLACRFLLFCYHRDPAGRTVQNMNCLKK